jgi:hypothetical protein
MKPDPVAVALAAFLAGLAACGGANPASPSVQPERSAALPARSPAPPPEPLEPVEVQVQATRVGNSVRLDITGVGRRRPERHAMEYPRNWTILVKVGEEILERTVNGSVRVARHPVGRVDSGLWDITVMFTVAYAVPGPAKAMIVRIQAPESEPFETTLEVAAEPTPEAPRRSR